MMMMHVHVMDGGVHACMDDDDACACHGWMDDDDDDACLPACLPLPPHHQPETIEAINACNVAGVKLMTALQRRFDPNFARVKEGIVSGQVTAP